MLDDRLAALERDARLMKDKRNILNCIPSSSPGNAHCDKNLIAGSDHADGVCGGTCSGPPTSKSPWRAGRSLPTAAA